MPRIIGIVMLAGALWSGLLLLMLCLCKAAKAGDEQSGGSWAGAQEHAPEQVGHAPPGIDLSAHPRPTRGTSNRAGAPDRLETPGSEDPPYPAIIDRHGYEPTARPGQRALELCPIKDPASDRLAYRARNAGS